MKYSLRYEEECRNFKEKKFRCYVKNSPLSCSSAKEVLYYRQIGIYGLKCRLRPLLNYASIVERNQILGEFCLSIHY